MIKSIIAAKGANNVIGKANGMVWHLPADLKYFKNKTKGHYVVMGRKTFESLGTPLPGRPTIIVTRRKDYHPANCYVVHDLLAAFKLAEQKKEEELYILGGSEIYKQTLSVADKMYLTEIKATFDGDAYFPEFNTENWTEVNREEHEADEKNKYAYTFVEYIRKK